MTFTEWEPFNFTVTQLDELFELIGRNDEGAVGFAGQLGQHISGLKVGAKLERESPTKAEVRVTIKKFEQEVKQLIQHLEVIVPATNGLVFGALCADLGITNPYGFQTHLLRDLGLLLKAVEYCKQEPAPRRGPRRKIARRFFAYMVAKDFIEFLGEKPTKTANPKKGNGKFAKVLSFGLGIAGEYEPRHLKDLVSETVEELRNPTAIITDNLV